MASNVEKLHYDFDVMRCEKCGEFETRLLAQLRRFNELRCGKCNGPLVLFQSAAPREGDSR